MVDTLTQVPDELFAGDSLAWDLDLSDYPASVWTITYYFSNLLDSFSIVGVASGDTHQFSEIGANTGEYKAGVYRWNARADNGSGTIETINHGWITVREDPSKQKVDWRSHAQKMVDAIEATLEGQATKEQLDLLSYSFGTVNVSRDRGKLLDIRDKYARELTGSQSGTRHIGLRFTLP